MNTVNLKIAIGKHVTSNTLGKLSCNSFPFKRNKISDGSDGPSPHSPHSIARENMDECRFFLFNFHRVCVLLHGLLLLPNEIISQFAVGEWQCKRGRTILKGLLSCQYTYRTLINVNQLYPPGQRGGQTLNSKFEGKKKEKERKKKPTYQCKTQRKNQKSLLPPSNFNSCKRHLCGH